MPRLNSGLQIDLEKPVHMTFGQSLRGTLGWAIWPLPFRRLEPPLFLGM